MDDVIQAHGANRGARCCKCKSDADFDELVAKIQAGEIMWCQKCLDKGKNFAVKPNIVFFGE